MFVLSDKQEEQLLYKRLQRALRRIELLQQEIHEYYSHFRISNNLLELRNLVTVARLIVLCAMQRKESRGLHYNLDYPDTLASSSPTILSPCALAKSTSTTK